MADFSALPYFLSDGSTINSQPPTPNLAEAAFAARLGQAAGVVSPGLQAPQGLHLHWALPDALTVGRNRDEGTQFPAVPNRWLVRRLDAGGNLQKSWIVESDFLHPLDAKSKPTFQAPPSNGGQAVTAWPGGKPITFPTKRIQLPNGKAGAAYRYMGRALALSDWLAEPATGRDYLNQPAFSDYTLSAVGYGEPAFAAYYPNCYSIFGFCDIDPALQPATSYEYQVIGWYNEPQRDPLQSPDFTSLKSDADKYQRLATEFQWIVSEADQKQPFPARTVLYVSLSLTPQTAGPWSSQGSVSFGIGNTGTEALAALLATQVAAGQPAAKPMIEDQLEALNIASVLQGVQIDYQANFDQTRHGRGFVGIEAGDLWAIRPKSAPVTSAQQACAAAAAKDSITTQIPDPVAHALDELNGAQEAYYRARQDIVETRYQTFSDWHKFMVAFYSNANWLQNFRVNSDSMRDFTERVDVGPLTQKLTATGLLKHQGLVWQCQGAVAATLDLGAGVLTPSTFANSTLAAQVLLRLKALIDALNAAGLSATWEITPQPAARFWRPREPVVLVSGDEAVSTPRHGEDGALPAGVLSIPDTPGSAAFFNAIGSLKPASGDPGLQTQKEPPWHPILLEWAVDVSPVTSQRVVNSDAADTLDYTPAFLTGNYTLGNNQVDILPGAPLTLGTRDTYEGRCVLTPTASTQFNTNITDYLSSVSLYDLRDRAADQETGYLDRLIAFYEVKHSTDPPPSNASDKLVWIRSRKPFVDSAGNLFAIADLIAWYATKPVAGANNTFGGWSPAQQAADPVYTALRAASALNGLNVLSQALGGFNAALMTREQVLQIPIEDPLASKQPKNFQQLTLDVSQAVGRDHPTAPLSAKVFCPIRSGQLGLNAIRLIDTFGQQWNAPLNGAALAISNGYTNPNFPGAVYLPPRFVPPSRLSFRWLAALSGHDGDEVEMNSAPVTSPICGWFLPNNFENSLMVYDSQGQALGSINSLAEWAPAPDVNHRIAPAEIGDPHLRRLIRRLVVDSGTPVGEAKIRQDFIAGLLSTIDNALEAIEPANFAQHEALALLIGRPVAIVRAQVDLQIMGQPVDILSGPDSGLPGGQSFDISKSPYWKSFADQNWDVYAYDWGKFYGCTYNQVNNGSCLFLQPIPPVNQYARTTHGFEDVVVPVRIGEHQLLNDGLVGFWKETADGDLDNVFHAPQTIDGLNLPPDVVYKPGLTTPCIEVFSKDSPDNLQLRVQDDPLELTILMDPRGVVHATCGVLPVQQLQIPALYYAAALKQMGVTFRVGPILTDSEQLHAALPKEPGFKWSWVTKLNGSIWQETSDIADATPRAEFFLNPLLVDGWFRLVPTEDNQEVS
jgi:hypothetical protein